MFTLEEITQWRREIVRETDYLWNNYCLRCTKVPPESLHNKSRQNPVCARCPITENFAILSGELDNLVRAKRELKYGEHWEERFPIKDKRGQGI